MNELCPVCLNGNMEEVIPNPKDYEYFKFRKMDSSIYKCDSCHSLAQKPALTEVEAFSLYDANYQNYNQSPSFIIRYLFNLLAKRGAESFVRTYGRDVSVLDYGCGFGNFLLSLQRMGVKELFGFDYIKQESTNGIRLFDSLEDIEKSGSRFDVIRMNHVIEHLIDVDQTMSILTRLLNPNGVIVGQTPNADCLSFKFFKRFWGALHYPYHTYVFTAQGLALNAKRWNMRLKDSKGALLPTGWAMSIENIFKYRTHSNQRGRTRFYPAFLLIGAIPTLLEVLCQKYIGPSIFNFVLEKNENK